MDISSVSTVKGQGLSQPIVDFHTVQELTVIKNPPGKCKFNRHQASFVRHLMRPNFAQNLKIIKETINSTDAGFRVCFGIRFKNGTVPTCEPARTVETCFIQLWNSLCRFDVNAANVVICFKNAGAEVDAEILESANQIIELSKKKN